MMNKKSNRESAKNKFEDMVNMIKKEIISGKLKPGDYLPSEKMISKQYGLSNITVRQGLEILVGERLIEKIPRVGNRVINPTEHGIVTLKFSCYNSLLDEASIEYLISDFHKLHPNIRIQPTFLQTGYFHDMFTELLDRDAVDVISVNHQDLKILEQHQCLDELENLESNAEHYPFLAETMLIDGHLKVQPFIFTPLVLCYNKGHFHEKRIPEPDSSWRWRDLFSYSDQLAIENQRLGFYCHLLSRTRWPVFLLQSGAVFTRNEKGKFNIRDTAIMDSIRAGRDMVNMLNRNPIILSESDSDAEELFFNGKVSMIMTTYLSLNHQTQKPDFQFEVAPLPYLNEPKSLLQIIGLAVCSQSKEKDAAHTFVEYMTSYRAQLHIRQKTLSIPASKLAAEWSGKEYMYRPSRFYMYRDIIPTFQVPTVLNISLSEMDVFMREVKLYWSGLETEEALCERLEELL